MFMLAMIPTLIRSARKRQREHGDLYRRICSPFSVRRTSRRLFDTGSGDAEDAASDDFVKPARSLSNSLLVQQVDEKDKHLAFIPTARLALTFCILWFGANYFAMACLQHTTVASTTILTSTSSFWTLLIGAFTGMERFTWRKLCGVLGSLVGIILISRVDLATSSNDETVLPTSTPVRSFWVRESDTGDTFPEKSPSELALGDSLALLSAIIYGVYTITLKKTTIKALPRSLNMPLFFGMVGFFNIILLFPLFPILHLTGLEHFRFPPTRRIWTIMLVNSVSSLCSDICWAYAMVLTSPLVVTVGLSLTIPLSLVGEMVLQGHYEGWVYWVGAAIVVGSFIFVDHEEREEGDEEEPGDSQAGDYEDAEDDATLRPGDGHDELVPGITAPDKKSRTADSSPGAGPVDRADEGQGRGFRPRRRSGGASHSHGNDDDRGDILLDDSE